MINLESRSFITADGMRFVSSGESERDRNRMHIYPPDSPLRFGMYASILTSLVHNTVPKKIFLRNEENYEVIDPKALVDIRQLPVQQRRAEINAIADRMFWSEEIIVEDANPEIITIQNVPQVIFETVIPVMDELDLAT